MPSLKIVAAAAALAIAGTRATEISLPPCLEPFKPFVYSGCFKDLHEPQALQWRTPLDQTNMTHEMCMAQCKGNGFRYAGLAYYGVCYCGQTVKGTQVDDSQCSFKCSGNANQNCGGDNALSVYTDPTFLPIDQTTIADYNHLGCWTDDSRIGRALTFRQNQVDSSTLTTEKCLTACRNEGYPFAGTEYGGECWCGVVIANDTRAAPASECTKPCNGDQTETCGGPGRLNLYVADELRSLEPCGQEPPVSSSSSVPTVVPSSSAASSASTVSSVPPTSSGPATTGSESSGSISSNGPTSSGSATITSPSSTTPSTTLTPSTPSPPLTTSTPSTTTPSTTTPSTTTPSTPSKTESQCTKTTTIPATCEYRIGKWCSNPIPAWDSRTSCQHSISACKLQLTSCFKHAGFPESLNCLEYGLWCSSLEKYCTSATNGGSKSTCLKQYPPKSPNKPMTVTLVTPCTSSATTLHTTTTTTPPTSTTQCPIPPTATNICTQPSSGKYYYWPGSPVGSIPLPMLTCNDLAYSHAQYPFKLYNEVHSSNCLKYKRDDVASACAAACKEQYDDCVEVYAEGCKKRKARGVVKAKGLLGGEDYHTATERCKAQYSDCLVANKHVEAKGKCDRFAEGPW